MAVAVVTTKLPILLIADLGPLRVCSLDTYGFWAVLLGSLVLVDAGGPWSLDRMLGRVRSGAGL